jgi:hypothetical protein
MNSGASPVPTSPVSQTGIRSPVSVSQLDMSHHVTFATLAVTFTNLRYHDYPFDYESNGPRSLRHRDCGNHDQRRMPTAPAQPGPLTRTVTEAAGPLPAAGHASYFATSESRVPGPGCHRRRLMITGCGHAGAWSRPTRRPPLLLTPGLSRVTGRRRRGLKRDLNTATVPRMPA